MSINYKSLRLKAGLEVHMQIDVKKKLFCACSTAMKEKIPTTTIIRRQHPVASETGGVDIAAQFEYLRGRVFHYQVFPNEVCLVCLDEEPPHEINKEALEVVLQVALLFNCSIPEELHIMRKLVLDGSTPMSYQRSAIIGLNGHISYKGKRIVITQISLEEDAAAIVGEENGKIVYRLNRLGVPLVEIDTGILEGFSPQELQEIAYQIGILSRSTNKTKHGIGSIRQDVNVSIRNGPRTEVKGVQELGLLSKIVEFEVQRQLKEKPKEETRAADIDGTTRFLRPLSGANRMYPETDIPPVVITKEYFNSLEKNLPEPWTNKLNRFKIKLRLPDGLAREILGSEYLSLFEKIIATKKVGPTIVANTFTSVIKDLERSRVEINRISEYRLIEVFDYVQDKKITKEAIPEIIKYLAAYPQNGGADALKELDLKPVTPAEVRQITEEILSQQPNMPFEKIYGIVMSKVRGKIDAQEVMKIVKSTMK